MKVILWMATSLNGIIAGKDGNEDFLSHDNWIEFSRFTNKIGCLIWGRKTYENVKTWDKAYLDDLKNVTKIIVSHKPSLHPEEGFLLANSPLESLHIAAKKGFTQVVLTGGSTNNSAFAKLGLIDEVIVNVNSVIIGEGIPLFAPDNFEMKLQLLTSKRVIDNIAEMRYKVLK